jgi:pimeloyl-ACP methyl ester carboxylesterase
MSITLRGRGGLELAADHFPAPGSTPVLLLHGGGQTRHAWGETAIALTARGWPTTAVDLRGHGESSWAPDGDYSLAAFAGDVVSLVGSCDSPPVLVGASLGGMASLQALADHPDLQVAGLILVDVAHRFEHAGARRVADFMGAGRSGFDHPSEASDAVAEYLPHRQRPTDPNGIVRNLRLREGRWRWHWDPALLDAFPAAMDPERVEQQARRMEATLGSLTIPVLLIRGGHSDVVTPAIADEFEAFAPTGKVVEVSGARHMIAGDSNDKFTSAVLDFLAHRVGGNERRSA